MTTTPSRTTFSTLGPVTAVITATVLALTACSSSDSTSGAQGAARAQASRITAAIAEGSTSAAPKGPTIDLATLDACSLITATDANRIAHADQFDELQDASTVYTLTFTKPVGDDPSCHLSITDSVEEGDATFVFQPATAFLIGPQDTRVSGLGTEAYDDGDGPVVRLGNITISAVDNSFTDSMTVALIRAMVAKLK